MNFIASFAKRLVLSCFLCLVSACTLPTAPTAIPVRATPSIAPVTSTVETTGDCYYVEASNPLPESAAAVRLAVEAAGVTVQDVTVQGQGENYVCTDTNASQFGVRASFVTVIFQVEDVNDTEQLGAAAGEILDALNGLTNEKLPNWSSGQVTLIAAAHEDQVKLEFPGSHGLSLREQGLTGAALWEGLGNLPCQTSTTYKKLEDLSAQIQSELNAAGLTNATAYVEATVYECIDPATNAVENSTVGLTSYWVAMDVENVNEKTRMGDLAAQALAVVVMFPPPESVDQPAGEVRLSFNSIASEAIYVISFDTAVEAVNRGLSGEELITLLETVY